MTRAEEAQAYVDRGWPESTVKVSKWFLETQTLRDALLKIRYQPCKPEEHDYMGSQCASCIASDALDEEQAEQAKAGTWDDPYQELREFVDPKTGGGPLDPKFRRQIGELLRFRDEFRAED